MREFGIRKTFEKVEGMKCFWLTLWLTVNKLYKTFIPAVADANLIEAHSNMCIGQMYSHVNRRWCRAA